MSQISDNGCTAVMEPHALLSSEDTDAVLLWAHDASADNEIVATFWEKLRETVGQPSDAGSDQVMSELRLYGGNSFVNFFRGEGVPYSEVAYDVAEVLRPFFDSSECKSNDVVSCESYVLRRMEVKNDDIEKLCEAVNAHGMNEAVSAQVGKVTLLGTIKVAGTKVAEKVAQEAGAAVAERAIAEAGKQVAKKTAQKAAQHAAKKAGQKAAQKAAQKVAEQMAKQTLARILFALNVFLIAWTVIDLAGPALRVTIPAVTYVALLRRLFRASQCEL